MYGASKIQSRMRQIENEIRERAASCQLSQLSLLEQIAG